MKERMKKNNIVLASKKIIVFYIVILFAAVWMEYYNLFAFHTNKVSGGILSVLIYYFIYTYFAKLYKAFKIGTYQIGEVIFSQVLSIGIADSILYVECCLISNRYVNIIPGLITAFLQIVGIVIWAVLAKQYFIRNIRASKTLVIYGEDNVNEFAEKLYKKYNHLFNIKEYISSDISKEKLYSKIDQYDTIMLYEIGKGIRTDTMEYCIQKKKVLYMTPRIADIIVQGFDNRTLIDTPLLKYDYSYMQSKRFHWKRILDVGVSLLCLIFFVIPMLISMIAVKLEDGGPVFFKQKRCTKDGKIFEILKFRSMIVDAEKDGAVIPCVENDSRITKVGKVIRRFRIDEMPQIFNVLSGDMSIVGPRPERVEHVKEYVSELPEFQYRMRVKGGLTGYAQIFGKYNTSAYDKLKLDLMYIENQSLILDLKLIMLTLKIMFLPESTEGFETEKSRIIGKWGKAEYYSNTEKKVI